MFEGSLVESAALLQSRNRWPAVVSVSIQAMLAAALVSLPLLHPEVLPLHVPALSLVPPAPRPPEHVPQPQPVHVASSANALATPTSNTPIRGRTDLMPHLPGPDTGTDVPSLNPLNIGMGDSTLPAAVSNPANGPGLRIVRGPSNPGAPARISSGISAGLLLEPIRPEYPYIAKATRTEGTVVVQAVISKDGKIEDAHVLSGPPMLREAALAAVRSAHYRPYLLSGEPTEVVTTYSITFHLGG